MAQVLPRLEEGVSHGEALGARISHRVGVSPASANEAGSDLPEPEILTVRAHGPGVAAALGEHERPEDTDRNTGRSGCCWE